MAAKRKRGLDLKRRPMTPDEARYAEDHIVLELLGTHGPATLGYLVGGLDYDSCPSPDGRASLLIYWPERYDERRSYLRSILVRLRAAKLVRLVGRKWCRHDQSRTGRFKSLGSKSSSSS